MGAYGNKVIQTPTLDKLAAEGALFEQAFCNTPVCSASRASYLTGRLPSQHGVHDWIAGGNGNAPNVAVYPETEPCGTGINYTASETAFSDALKSKGFHLGFSGKIHVGNQPLAQHGFEHWFVHQLQSGGGDYQTPPFVVNATATSPGQCTLIPGYISDIVASDVVEQVNVHAKDSKPWYMAMHFTAPHAPYTGPDGLARSMHPAKYTELYDSISVQEDPLPNQPVAAWQSFASGSCTDWRPQTVTCFAPSSPACRAGLPGCAACTNGSAVTTSARKEYIKGYFGAVSAMDANIGRVVDTVEAAGLTRKTLFIFTSDHGYNVGHHGLCGKGNAGWPLNMFDTSLKIPMIWRMPGTIKAGARIQALTQVVDFANSLLAFVGSFDVDAGPTGYTLPDFANSPGVSYAHLLRNVSSLQSEVAPAATATAMAAALSGGPSPQPDGWRRAGRTQMTDASMRGLHFGEYGQTRSVRDSLYKYRATKEGLELGC